MWEKGEKRNATMFLIFAYEAKEVWKRFSKTLGEF